MYYARLNSDVTDFDPVVVTEASPRDKVVDTQLNIEEVVDNFNDDISVRSKVSRVLSSLEQEVLRSGRTIRQTTTYDPMTGKGDPIGAEISAV